MKQLKSFRYKAKLLGNTEADEANGILKSATTAVPLKYLSNFWRSKMPLIICKVELKLKLTRHCISSAGGNDNVNGEDNTKDTSLYAPVATLSARI